TQNPMIIYGDGNQTRDFTYVEDAIEAVHLAAIDHKAIGRVYNVGTGVETSVIELAQVVHEVTDEENLLLQFMPKRKVDVVQRRSIDSKKIQTELNWTINHSLQEGIQKTYNWLKNGGRS